MTRHLTVEQALRIARAATGGAVVPRDVRLLESAVQRPRASVLGQDAYRDVLTKAASLLHSPAWNNALVDGNKRLAWLARMPSARRTGSSSIRTMRAHTSWPSPWRRALEGVGEIAERLRSFVAG